MTKVTINALTPRETEILTLIAEGDSLAEIAQKLGRSLKTIESHRLSIGRKLKAGNRVELAKIAIANGLVRLEAEPSSTTNSGPAMSLEWISAINQAIQQATGRELLERFCKAASLLPGIDIAAICTSQPVDEPGRCDQYSRVVMAVSDNGRLAKPIRYNAMQTPCQHVIDNGILMVEKDITSQFPDDPWLAQADADGYLGLLLNNADGKPSGGVGLISRGKMEHTDSLRQVVEFFTPRLAGAIQNCIEIEALRAENDRLHAGMIQPSVDSGNNAKARLRIAHRVDQLAGTAFLREFIDATCGEYGLFAGGICALAPGLANQTLHSVSFCVQSKQGDPIEYQATGTPCEFVMKHANLCLPDKAAEAYPGDQFLQDNAIRGFCGNRLSGPSGDTVGVVWVVHKESLPDPEGIESLLRYYSPRIGAELANFMQFEMLMQERERLERQLANKVKPRATTPA